MGSSQSSPGRPARFDDHELWAAAVAVIDDEGLEATTIRAIAGRIGLSPMAIYRVVDSKVDLLERIPDHLVRDLLDDFPTDGGGLAALRYIVRVVADVLERHPNIAPLFQRPIVGPHMAAGAQRCVSALVADGLAPERAGGVLRATMALDIGLHITGGASATEEISPMASDAIEIWLRGVAAELA